MNNIYNLDNISKLIRETRKAIGISQEQLSKKCSVSRSTVIKWEQGKIEPDMHSLLTMCNLFDCELGYILGEEGYEEGKRTVTDICKATGLSKSAADTLIKDTEYRDSDALFSMLCSTRVRVINSLLQEGSGDKLIYAIDRYVNFEHERQCLSNVIDLKLLQDGKPSILSGFDSTDAMGVARLLIEKKIPIIYNDILEEGYELKDLDLTDGESVYDDMIGLIDFVLKRAEANGEVLSDFYKLFKGYVFSDEEKRTLCYLFFYFEDVLMDPTGKVNQFALTEIFKDYIRESMESIRWGVENG